MVKPEGHANRMYERLRAAYPRVDAEYHAQPAPIRTLEDLPEADLIALLHGIPDVEFWHANLVATQGEQASVLFDAKLASCRANMDAEAKASLGGGAPETQDERIVALTKTDGYLNRAERDAEIFKRPPAPPPELAPLNVNDVLELIGHFMSDPLDAELEKAIVDNPELFSGEPDPLDKARAINARLLHKDDDLPPQAPSDWDMDGQGVVEAMPAVSNVPPEIAALLDDGETLTRDVRRKLTERLNVELAELKNLRGLAGEDLKREAEIEKLLGLFARLGEI